MRSTTKFPHSGTAKCECGKPGVIEIRIPTIPVWYRCEECEAQFQRELQWELLGAQRYKDEIICPFCGEEFTDSWEIEDDQEEYECEECGRKFDIEVHHETTYSTKRSLCEMPDDWRSEDDDET